MTEAMRNAWRVWDTSEDYGQILYRRALGELPEMESAKAVARRMRSQVRDGDCLLDVGCGAGHYLRSLRREIGPGFFYTGIDATARYIELARIAWRDDARAQFRVADAFALPEADASYDIVLSCNLFLHLPSVATPLGELVRVARRFVLVRTLVGERSFRIQEVRAGGAGEEFDEQGEPLSFNYYNIYSRPYLERLLRRVPRARKWEIVPDRDFRAAGVAGDPARLASANATYMLGEWQVNGYVLQPWHFVLIEIGD